MKPADYERQERTNKMLSALIDDYLSSEPTHPEDFALAETTNRGLCMVLKARQAWLNKKKERIS